MADPIPYMRLFIGGFTAETQHLTASQLGNHTRMLLLAWRRVACSIPDDQQWISRRLRIGAEEYNRDVVPVIADLWVSDGEDLINEDLRAERFHVEERSQKARKAALIRYGENIHPLKEKRK